MSEKSICDIIAEFASGLRYEDLDETTVKHTKLVLLDFFASAAAGYRVNSVFNAMASDLFIGMGGVQESSVLFSDKKLPACNAAFLNGVYAHGADIDDGHRLAMGHPGCAIIPAVLALAEKENRSIADVIAGMVVGYDVYVRVSAAVMPGHFDRGFHGTGTVGALGAAAGAARTLGLSAIETRNAISLAAVQASGLLEVADSGQMVKPVNPARAAYNGVISALLAAAGAEAPEFALTGDKGFFRAFCDNVDVSRITDGLGSRYSINGNYIKQYPACRHIHGMVDCARKIYRANSAPVEQIKSATLYAYPAAVKVVGRIRTPSVLDEAKFSLTYATALGLTRGAFGLEDLYAAKDQCATLSGLISRMKVESDPALDNRDEGVRGARLEIELVDGRKIYESCRLPKGEPEDPVDYGDIVAKMASCAKGVLDESRQVAFSERVMALKDDEKIAPLMRMLS